MKVEDPAVAPEVKIEIDVAEEGSLDLGSPGTTTGNIPLSVCLYILRGRERKGERKKVLCTGRRGRRGDSTLPQVIFLCVFVCVCVCVCVWVCVCVCV